MEGRYRVLGALGRGSTTEVLEAKLKGGFERRVAIKRLLPELRGDTAQAKRFVDAARGASRLHHANIVAVLDFGTVDDAPFVVMEMVDGASARTLLGSDHPLPVAAALHVATEVAHAVEYAHAQGVSHGRLRLEDVLIGWTGDVKVGDFLAPDSPDPLADVAALSEMLQELLKDHTTDEILSPLFDETRFDNAAGFATACGSALAKRATRDGRSLLVEWLAVASPDPTPTLEPNATLFDMEPVSTDSDQLTRYKSIVITVPEQTTEDDPDDLDTILPEPGTEKIIGTKLQNYQIEELIAATAHSRVFRARHLALDRMYAIKMLRANARPTTIRRLKREAMALAELNHENIVRVVDFGTTTNGETYLVTEFFEGINLYDEIMNVGALPVPRMVTIVRQILLGLEAAHAAGIIHRDLKPANVLLLPGDQVRLLDFGIARLATYQGDLSQLTHPAQLLGTPNYIAPEQIRSPKDATPRSDLYGLGALMYRMLTGRPPFPGKRRRVIEMHLSAPVPEVPPADGLEDVIRSLLAKRPEDRPPSARSVIQQLDELFEPAATLMQQPVLAPPPAPKSNRGWIVGAFLMVPIAFAMGFWVSMREPPMSDTAEVPAPPPAKAAPRPVAAPAKVVSTPDAVKPPPPPVVTTPRRRRKRTATVEAAPPPPPPKPAAPPVPVDKRLARLKRQLAALALSIDPEELSKLDDRYLDLLEERKRVPKEQLLPALRSLERDVERLSRSSRTSPG